MPETSSTSSTGSRPGRLGVGIISAGRVGAVLGSALRAVDHQVIGVHAVSAASRERAEALLPGVPVLDVDEIVERAELVLLAVPDDALAALVRGLADLGRWQPGQLVVHTSGRYGTGILEPARRLGAIPLALHPAMTFGGFSADVARLTGCPMAVTAPDAVLPIAQALAVELGGEPFVLPEASRPAYHAALAHGANHLVTLVGQAVRILAAAGVMALFGLGYILGSLTEALALALPMWAAKLIVAIVLLIVAFIAARAGMKKLEEGRQSMPDPRASIQADVDAVTASFTAGLSKGEQK